MVRDKAQGAAPCGTTSQPRHSTRKPTTAAHTRHLCSGPPARLKWPVLRAARALHHHPCVLMRVHCACWCYWWWWSWQRWAAANRACLRSAAASAAAVPLLAIEAAICRIRCVFWMLPPSCFYCGWLGLLHACLECVVGDNDLELANACLFVAHAGFNNSLMC